MLRGLYHLAFNPRARAEWRWSALRKISQWLMPGYRLIWPQMRWWQDEEFNNFLRRFNEFGGHNTDRRRIVQQLLQLIRNVPGDTAECGVLAGSSSYLICKAYPERTHFMFDSFEGCSSPTGRDSGYFSDNSLAVGLEEAQKNLHDCPNGRFMKGWIPERFSEVAGRQFAFVHIDVQQEQPTRDSLSFFYPRMNPGGIMVFDDYGFTTCPGARHAIDEFMQDKDEPIVDLPTGSAFIIRSIS